jgi:truncated hemoglobin YjbI
MRLDPTVTEAEVHAWLTVQVDAMKLVTRPDDLAETLTATAEAMAAISKVVLPDEQEPHFP